MHACLHSPIFGDGLRGPPVAGALAISFILAIDLHAIVLTRAPQVLA